MESSYNRPSGRDIISPYQLGLPENARLRRQTGIEPDVRQALDLTSDEPDFNVDPVANGLSADAEFLDAFQGSPPFRFLDLVSVGVPRSEAIDSDIFHDGLTPL